MVQGLPSYVSVGVGTYMADTSFYRWGDERIIIGKYCSIAQQVRILAGGGHRTDMVSTFPFDSLLLSYPGNSNPPKERSYVCGKGIEIGNDVWIGFGATIIGHVKIGDGAVIGAGAVVMTDVEPYGIALGNPARAYKYRHSEAVVRALLDLKWWDWPQSRIAELVKAGAFERPERLLEVGVGVHVEA